MYMLVEWYLLVDGYEVWYLDFYCIGYVGELDFFGFDEGSVLLWLVEWLEWGVGVLLFIDLVVVLEIEG